MKPDSELQMIVQRHVDYMLTECDPKSEQEFAMVLGTVTRACLGHLVDDIGFERTMMLVASIAANIAPAGHKVELARVDVGKVPFKMDA